MGLGIAVYPELENINQKQILNYIELASRKGFDRLFLDLLGFAKHPNKQKVIEDFKNVCAYAKKFNFRTFVDINHSLFETLGFEFDSPESIAFFAELGVTGIRLDENFGGEREAKFSHQSNGLKLEINASSLNGFEDKLLQNNAKMSNLAACHNFYPQQYTGIASELFFASSKKLKDMGLLIASWVTLDPNDKDVIGPISVNDGMPTLEDLRFKSLSYQTRFYLASGVVDDILISGMFATEQQMETMSRYEKDALNLHVIVDKDITANEREIAFNYKEHFIRGDYSDYMLRSTMTRLKYSHLDIKPRPCAVEYFKLGDVVMPNENLGRYKGEIQIITKPVINDGKRNLIGRLAEEDIELLKFKKPWMKFFLYDAKEVMSND